MSKSRAEVREHFHSSVDLGTGPSADYVVAHATRQRQRGKNPSVKYKGHTSPRESLAAAKLDIEARDIDDNYTAVFSGRIAIIKVWSELQKDRAYKYADLLMENNNAAGAVIQDLNELIDSLREKGELGHKEPLSIPTPLHHHVTGQGTVEAMLPL